MITLTRKGGRIVQLYLPFDYGERQVKAIELMPVTWGQNLDWQAGEYQSSMELLAEITGEDEALLRQIRYPDTERVLMQFMEIVPDEIRNSIASGNLPRWKHAPPPPEPVVEENSEPYVGPELRPEPPQEMPASDEPDQPESQRPSDWPDEHVEHTDPDKFDPTKWDGILEEARKKEKPKDSGVGFDLGEGR